MNQFELRHKLRQLEEEFANGLLGGFVQSDPSKEPYALQEALRAAFLNTLCQTLEEHRDNYVMQMWIRSSYLRQIEMVSSWGTNGDA